MAYIRKLADGKHRAEIERNGIRASKVCETKRKAQAWALEQEGTAKRARKGGNKSFGDAVAKYKEAVSSKKDGEIWEVRRLDVMEKHFKSATPLIKIDTPDIADWRDKRLETVSASTVVREANLLRNLFNLARKEWKWMDNEPFLGVKLPKEGDPRHQLWTWQLIKQVLRADRVGKTKEMQEAFHIALRTGMRLGEVLDAPDNFDPKKQVVTIKTKTEKLARIPIGRIASKLLAGQSFTVGPNEGSTLFSGSVKNS